MEEMEKVKVNKDSAWVLSAGNEIRVRSVEWRPTRYPHVTVKEKETFRLYWASC